MWPPPGLACYRRSVKGARRAAKYEDLCKVPDTMVGEIIDGELVVTPRPALPHTLAASAIGSVLFDRFNRDPGAPGEAGGWWILDEPELHLGADVLVPDLAGWRRERMPTLPDAAACRLAPDWVCEIVSPRTAGIDRGHKTTLYARERVAHLWLVDPPARTLEVYRREDAGWLLASTHTGAGAVRAEPFEAIELDAARWWIGS